MRKFLRRKINALKFHLFDPAGELKVRTGLAKSSFERKLFWTRAKPEHKQKIISLQNAIKSAKTWREFQMAEHQVMALAKENWFSEGLFDELNILLHQSPLNLENPRAREEAALAFARLQEKRSDLAKGPLPENILKAMLNEARTPEEAKQLRDVIARQRREEIKEKNK